jgi:hypothetical protein
MKRRKCVYFQYVLPEDMETKMLACFEEEEKGIEYEVEFTNVCKTAIKQFFWSAPFEKIVSLKITLSSDDFSRQDFFVERLVMARKLEKLHLDNIIESFPDGFIGMIHPFIKCLTIDTFAREEFHFLPLHQHESLFPQLETFHWDQGTFFSESQLKDISSLLWDLSSFPQLISFRFGCKRRIHHNDHHMSSSYWKELENFEEVMAQKIVSSKLQNLTLLNVFPEDKFFCHFGKSCGHLKELWMTKVHDSILTDLAAFYSSFKGPFQMEKLQLAENIIFEDPQCSSGAPSIFDFFSRLKFFEISLFQVPVKDKIAFFSKLVPENMKGLALKDILEDDVVWLSQNFLPRVSSQFTFLDFDWGPLRTDYDLLVKNPSQFIHSQKMNFFVEALENNRNLRSLTLFISSVLGNNLKFQEFMHTDKLITKIHFWEGYSSFEFEKEWETLYERNHAFQNLVSQSSQKTKHFILSSKLPKTSLLYKSLWAQFILQPF